MSTLKTIDWIILLGLGIGGYLLWVANAAGSMQWIVQNVGLSANGLTTSLNLTFTVQNPGSVTINITNMLVSVAYNGTVVGTGLVTAAVPVGTSQVQVPVVMSDISLLLDLSSDIANGNSGSVLTITGKGVVNGLPGSFSTNYTLP